MIIYLITNKINNKQHVGQTTRSLMQRWQDHRCQGVTSRSALKSAIKKYGIDNFSIKSIDTANTIEELNQKEQYWIKKLQTLSKGYNLTSGGKNYILSQQSKDKIGQASLGRKLSAKTKEKLKKIHVGSKRSKKSCQKMSIAAKNDPKRKNHLNCISPRRQIIDNKGNTYESIKFASIDTGISRSSIHKVLKQKWIQVKGYIFKYVE